MKGKDGKIFLDALTALEKEKGISKESLLETVEQALLAAYKKHFGEEENVEVEINRESGEINVYEVKTVVDDVYDAALEVTPADAKEATKKNYKIGDIARIPVNCEEFRRNAIQNGKQIVIQKVREAERTNIYDKFKAREFDIMTGIIRRIDEKRSIFIEFDGTEAFLPTSEQSPADVYRVGDKAREFDIMTGIIRRIDEKRSIFIEFDGTEAFLPTSEQSPADVYRVGDRIKVYVAEVEKTNKFPKVVISRKNEGLLKKLFELEIPEIAEGLIEIKSVAREAGSRAKIAVYSQDKNIDTIGACIGQKGLRIKNIVDELNGEKIDMAREAGSRAKIAVYSQDKNIDTIGACIGQKGLRIKNIVDELNGEKIDIVEWKESMEEFVSAVLSPAKVNSVELLEDGTTARVIVDPSQLSLAIGKNGQNARLAAKLTGTRVDIKVAEKND